MVMIKIKNIFVLAAAFTAVCYSAFAEDTKSEPPPPREEARSVEQTTPEQAVTPEQTVMPEQIAAAEKTAAAGQTPVPEAGPNTFSAIKIDFDTNTIKSIALSWKGGENSTYRIMRKGPGENIFYDMSGEPAAVSSYIDGAVRTGVSYSYYLEVYDSLGNSANTAVFTVKSADFFLPGKPGEFKTYQDRKAVLIKWTHSLKGTFEIAGYNLYRGKTEALSLIHI